MQVVKWAKEFGQSLRKEQTGFLHYCHQNKGSDVHDTIPLLENALLALSLFRTKTADGVAEGKELFQNLLAFEVEGTFPTYLHRYPHIDDPYLHLRLLPVFFWAKEEFGHVIGSLKHTFELVIDRIVEKAKSQELPEWGKARLDALEGILSANPSNLQEWSETLISLQIAERRGADITKYLEQASKYWHPEIQLYIGPGTRRNQYKTDRDISFFDLFMAEWQGCFSQRFERFRPAHLLGALIQPVNVPFVSSHQSVPYLNFKTEDECPWYMAWEDHSLCFAGPAVQIEGNLDELILSPHHTDDEWVGAFYLSFHEDHQFFVNGQRATVFEEDQEMVILAGGMKITVSLTATDGKYFCHIMRGNRPSQHACVGEDHFEAFDWKIALRAVKWGKEPIRMRLRYEVQELVNH